MCSTVRSAGGKVSDGGGVQRVVTLAWEHGKQLVGEH